MQRIAINWVTGVALVLCLLQASSVECHNRLECPPPRTGTTGGKSGPCDAPDNPALPPFPLVANALNTVTWLESLPHPGAVARFALSLDGVDDGFESCLLLDHIPHDEYSRPDPNDQRGFHRSSITLFIPDVYCQRCTLQLVTFMTDQAHGLSAGAHCAYQKAKDAGTVDTLLPTCTTTYHSCAPVSINGTIARNSITKCNTTAFETELGWSLSANELAHSTYLNRGNPGLYNQTYSQLLEVGAPLTKCFTYTYCDPRKFFHPIFQVPSKAKYTALTGGCARVVEMEVEDFVLGKLPSTPKDLTAPNPGNTLSFFYRLLLRIGGLLLPLVPCLI
jgi:hypothetical protein